MPKSKHSIRRAAGLEQRLADIAEKAKRKKRGDRCDQVTADVLADGWKVFTESCSLKVPPGKSASAFFADCEWAARYLGSILKREGQADRLPALAEASKLDPGEEWVLAILQLACNEFTKKGVLAQMFREQESAHLAGGLAAEAERVRRMLEPAVLPKSSVEPLTTRAEAVYQQIIKEGPLTGTQITRRTGIDQSTLTKEIMPELKRLRGIINKRGAGYYSPLHYRPQ